MNLDMFFGTSELIKLISSITWSRIEFARTRRGLKIYETTITQDLIHILYKYASESSGILKIMEAKSERTNGNDIEFYLETLNGYLFLPMQAKIVYDDFKYPMLEHTVGKTSQIELLINYAKKKGGHPLYLLYNYYNNLEYLKKMESITKTDFKNYGISYIDANILKSEYYNKILRRDKTLKWKIPDFSDLHPIHAKPFYRLWDDGKNKKNIQSSINQILGVDESHDNLRKYSIDELIDDEEWIDLNPSPSIGRTSQTIYKQSSEERDNYYDTKEFRPKFRIIISQLNPRKLSITFNK